MYVGKEQWLSLLYLIVLHEHKDASFGTTLFKLQYVATSRLRSVLVSRMTRVRPCGDAMFSEASFQVKSSFFGALHTALAFILRFLVLVYARDGVDDAALTCWKCRFPSPRNRQVAGLASSIYQEPWF